MVAISDEITASDSGANDENGKAVQTAGYIIIDRSRSCCYSAISAPHTYSGILF
jgi:hypothetical protein